MSDAGSIRHVVHRNTHGRIADEEQAVHSESTTFGSPEPKIGRLGDSGRLYRMGDRFLRRGKRKVGVADSLKAIAFSSCKFSTRRRTT